MYGRERNAKTSVGKFEGMRPLERSGYRWGIIFKWILRK
jgi:hypothetical protein